MPVALSSALCLRLQRGAVCGAEGAMAWGRGRGGEGARRALMSASLDCVTIRDRIVSRGLPWAFPGTAHGRFRETTGVPVKSVPGTL